MRTSSPQKKSRLLQAHIFAWSFAGMSAAVFLGWSLIDRAHDDALDARAPSRSLDGRLEDQALAGLGKVIRSIQDKVTIGDEHMHALMGRLVSLEEKTAVLAAGGMTSTGSAATTSAPHVAVQATTGSTSPPVQVPESGLRPSSITTGAILQRAQSPAAQTTTDVITTAIGLQPTAASGPAPTPAPKAVHAIQLTSAGNLDALRLNWSLLNERHRQLLGQLQTRYRQSPGKPNAPFQLIAGPVRSTADAARICKELATSGVSCRATTFSGEAL